MFIENGGDYIGGQKVIHLSCDGVEPDNVQCTLKCTGMNGEDLATVPGLDGRMSMLEAMDKLRKHVERDVPENCKPMKAKFLVNLSEVSYDESQGTVRQMFEDFVLSPTSSPPDPSDAEQSEQDEPMPAHVPLHRPSMKAPKPKAPVKKVMKKPAKNRKA